jgi:hypothetical protein
VLYKYLYTVESYEKNEDGEEEKEEESKDENGEGNIRAGSEKAGEKKKKKKDGENAMEHVKVKKSGRPSKGDIEISIRIKISGKHR